MVPKHFSAIRTAHRKAERYFSGARTGLGDGCRNDDAFFLAANILLHFFERNGIVLFFVDRGLVFCEEISVFSQDVEPFFGASLFLQARYSNPSY